MKEDTRWKLIAGMALVTLSLALYTAHYLIFQDAHHIIIYLLGDIAFIPLEVFVVTLIIDQMLESREKKQRMEKLNMVIGTFFSTTGTPLLSLLSRADPCIDIAPPEPRCPGQLDRSGVFRPQNDRGTVFLRREGGERRA